jgi:hypothetical protein
LNNRLHTVDSDFYLITGLPIRQDQRWARLNSRSDASGPEILNIDSEMNRHPPVEHKGYRFCILSGFGKYVLGDCRLGRQHHI